jgi:hypothetical protein
MDATLSAKLRSAYENLHAHPELSGQEHRTAAVFQPAEEAAADAKGIVDTRSPNSPSLSGRPHRGRPALA